MPLYVLLRGPQVTLQRRKRGLSMIICPKLRRWGLLPFLSLVLLSIAIASVGFFVITGVTLTTQKFHLENKLLQKRSREHHSRHFSPTNSHTHRVETLKLHRLINKSTPSVELSAQLTLNSLYGINNRDDILNYYKWLSCKGAGDEADCKKFTIVSKSENRTRWASMKSCGSYPSGLKGPVRVPSMKDLIAQRMDKGISKRIKPGGWWEPEGCLARHSIAIVIPYKDRWQHLVILLNHLHPLLQRQELRYKLFVVEQYGNDAFNKGILMNAAFLEALKEELFHCFIFHDVDMLPENDYNMYTCPEMPRHLSVAVNEFRYKLPYPFLVGGVFAIRTDHFFRVNGYSNFYWGWGGEDDDMGYRVWQSGLKITRPLPSIGRYTMIKHTKRRSFSYRVTQALLRTARKRNRLEGLNSVQYKLVEKKLHPWFTSFLVEVGKPPPSFTLHWFSRNYTKREASRSVPKKL